MKLLEKVLLGNVSLKNRMAMAAMTRGRAGTNGLVGDMTVEYYTKGQAQVCYLRKPSGLVKKLPAVHSPRVFSRLNR